MRPNGDRRRWHGPIPAGVAVRKVDFTSGGKTVGKVVVFVPLDGRLVTRLTRRSDLGAHRRLGFARGGTSSASGGR
jgi:hypothetical protein